MRRLVAMSLLVSAGCSDGIVHTPWPIEAFDAAFLLAVGPGIPEVIERFDGETRTVVEEVPPGHEAYLLAFDPGSLDTFGYTPNVKEASIAFATNEAPECASGRMSDEGRELSIPALGRSQLFRWTPDGFVSAPLQDPWDRAELSTPITPDGCKTTLEMRAFGASDLLLDEDTMLNGRPAPRERGSEIRDVFYDGPDAVIAATARYLLRFQRGLPFEDIARNRVLAADLTGRPGTVIRHVERYGPEHILVLFDLAPNQDPTDTLSMLALTSVSETGFSIVASSTHAGPQLDDLAVDSDGRVVMVHDDTVATEYVVTVDQPGDPARVRPTPGVRLKDIRATGLPEAPFVALGLESTMYLLRVFDRSSVQTSNITPPQISGIRPLASLKGFSVVETADGRDLWVGASLINEEGHLLRRPLTAAGDDEWTESPFWIAPTTLCATRENECGRRESAQSIDIAALDSLEHGLFRPTGCTEVFRVAPQPACEAQRLVRPGILPDGVDIEAIVEDERRVLAGGTFGLLLEVILP